MAEALRNGLAYALRGTRDCLHGFIKVYELHKTPSETGQLDVKVKNKRQTILSQRREETLAKNQVKSSDSEPKITHRIFQCMLWNGGVFWMSILLFDYVFIPSLQWLTQMFTGNSLLYSELWSWMGSMVSAIFGALWVLPLFIVSKVVNSLWFQDIADAAWKTKKYKARLPSIGLLIADMIFSLLVQTFFLTQSMAAGMLRIPPVAHCLTLIHLSVLYAMYAFEYRWFNAGWSISQRVAQIEHQWPYFLGFGLPLAYLTWIAQDMVVSGCIFAIFFPILIVSANEATLIKQDYDFPVRIFGLSIYVSNIIFKRSIDDRQSSTRSGSSTMSGSSTRSGSSPSGGSIGKVH